MPLFAGTRYVTVLLTIVRNRERSITWITLPNLAFSETSYPKAYDVAP
jgi:hypothetical protein